MDELNGRVINNFTLQEVIGRGSMGVVFRAYHQDLERYAAVKVMRPELVQQPNSYERFLQEARTAARLNHPNIVDVFNFGRIENSYYLMMDYLEGPNLRQLIAENPGGLPLADVAHIFTQIADVLAFAHSEGVLHRDLKPDNIIVTESRQNERPYQAMVTDFGLVKIAHNSITQTQEGVTLGTPAYMSPEQCRGLEVDARTDIYALGVMLYEALTGKRPYPIRNLFDAVKFHTSGNFVAPRAHVPTIPITLNALVRRMLNPDIDKRPPDAQAVIDQLARFVPKQPSSAYTSQVMERVAKDTGALPELEKGHDTEQHASTLPNSGIHTTAGASPDQICIVVTYHNNVEQILPLAKAIEKELVVGRQHNADIVLDKPERYVSKRHCAISVQNDNVYVRDLSSTNGTFLGAAKIEAGVPFLWPPESEINLGAFKLRLQLESEARAELSSVSAEATIVHGQQALVCAEGVPTRLMIRETPLLLGRVPGCDMVLNNPRISKRHCRIERVNGQILVTDLNSTNGTFLGAQRLEPDTPTVWADDVLRVGAFVVALES
ncbi:MAG: protein kinase [Anaerolineales bacterium]|nr:protein kinase [Anaerolineales bacterium]